MANGRVKKRSQKAGLPPGAMVHIGREHEEQVRITLFDYDEQHCAEKVMSTAEECFPYKESSTVTWINIDGVHDVPLIEKIGRGFDLHPLVLEDILNTGQRPKMEEYPGFIYIVLHMLSCCGSLEMKTEQVSIILEKNVVLTFQEAGGDVFDPLRDRIRSGKGRVRKSGADYLTYSILDIIVDNYFLVLESLGERIEILQENLIKDPRPDTLAEIHRLKKDLLFLRKAVWPLREVVSGLQRAESLFAEGTRIYLRDVYDHVIQVMDTLETYREMASGMLDIYLSSVSNRMNEVMKVLTIIATIFIPLTFLAGVYGMNFEYMPELKQPWAYPALWAIMISIGVSMVIWFKRRKWL